MINPRMVRGLDYYRRTAWELHHEGVGAKSALGGGGRYDGLAAQLGGPEVPGIGWAFGIERLLLALEADTAAPPADAPRADRHFTDAAVAFCKDLFAGREMNRWVSYDGVSAAYAAADDERVLGELPERVAVREGGRLERGVHGAVDGAEDAPDGEGRAWGRAHRHRDIEAVVHRGHAGHRAEVQLERFDVRGRLERGEEEGQRAELGGCGVKPHIPVEHRGRQGWVESKEGLRRERESW